MDINSSTLAKFNIGISAAFAGGLGKAPSQYKKIAMTIPSTTAQNTYPWLGTLPSLREWIGDRVIRNLAAHDYSIKNKKFESTVAVNRDDLEDDQVGIYGPMFDGLGKEAGVHPDRLIFGLLKKGHQERCFDGQYFFDTDHPVGKTSVANSFGDDSAPAWYLMCTKAPVMPLIFQTRRAYNLVRLDKDTDENVFMRGEYLYGVDARVNAGFGLWQCAIRCTSELTGDTYAQARAMMAEFKDDNGDPLGLVPDMLVVPGTLESAALGVLSMQLVKGGESNRWYNTAELLVSPWLA